MLTLLLPLLLVWSASAAGPCCMDRQFESRMGEMGDVLIRGKDGGLTASRIDTDNVVHYDYYNKMMAVEVTARHDNTTTNSDIIINLDTNEMYLTVNGNCQKMMNPAATPFIEPCIPANAKKVGSSYLGYGENAVAFTTWQFFVKDITQVVRLSVTDVGCVPIVEGAFGSVAGTQNEMVFILTNFKPGIKKPSIFNIPQNCPARTQTRDLPEEIEKVIKAAKKIVSFR